MKMLKFTLVAASLAFATCPAEAQTLSNVVTWRDVSNFINEHKIHPSLAMLYVQRQCHGLPAPSQAACLKEAFANPKSYQGLSTQWAEKTAAALNKRILEEERAQSLKQEAEDELRTVEDKRRADAQVTAEIEELKLRIKEQEKARAGIVENLGTLSRADAQQAKTILERYDVDLIELRTRLRLLVNTNDAAE